jgi:hypothetical protein
MSTSTPRVRAQLIADAVIASYIHDISVRHRRTASPNKRGPSVLSSGRSLRRQSPHSPSKGRLAWAHA